MELLEEKRCPTCKEDKPLSAFYRNATNNSRCKDCQRIITLKGYHELKERVPDGFPPVAQKGCKSCGLVKPGDEFYRQKWASTGLSAWCKACVRGKDLQRQYGIDPSDYSQMLDKQDGGCAICYMPPSPGKGLAVDHDHDTGKVRGLLCTSCNTALGKFPTVEMLKRAIEYLER